MAPTANIRNRGNARRLASFSVFSRSRTVWKSQRSTAVATVAGQEADRSALRSLARSGQDWATARDLQRAYGSDRRGVAPDLGPVGLAYAQSGAIGQYLASLKGGESLAQLMRAFANNGPWTEVKIMAGLLTREDGALREVYGLSAEQVFERAREWVASGAFGP